MKPEEVPPQAEPTPSRTRADPCHAPCHRSRDPGHEQVVTGTNPRRPGLSPTIVSGSARTWPARADSTCSERGCARARRDHLRQHRRPEAFYAPSLHILFLSVAWNAACGISRHFSPIEIPHATLSSSTSTDHHAARATTAPGGRRATSSPDELRQTLVTPQHRAVIRRCRRPASTADPLALPGVCEIFHLRLSTSALSRGDFDSRGGVGLPNHAQGGSRGRTGRPASPCTVGEPHAT